MSDYEITVCNLARNNKTARKLRREIRKMEISEIMRFLLNEGLNATGSEAESRERYWRYKLRKTDVEDKVPWNPHTDLANLKEKVGNLPVCEELWQTYVPRTRRGSNTEDLSDSSITDTEKSTNELSTKFTSKGLNPEFAPVRPRTLAIGTAATTSITTITASIGRGSTMGTHNFAETPLVTIGDNTSSQGMWGLNTTSVMSAFSGQPRPPHFGLPNADTNLAMQQRMSHIEDMLLRLTARLDGNETTGARANQTNSADKPKKIEKKLRVGKDKSTLGNSSDSEDDRYSGRRDARSRHSTRYDRTDCVKLMKNQNLHFSGNVNEDIL